MFLIEWIFIIIGSVLLFFSLLLRFFKNRIFDILNEYGLKTLFFAFGIVCVLLPGLLGIFFNRCEVCEKFVSTDYCTECGTYVAGVSLCSCGEVLVDGYSFCPSCGCEVEFCFD